MVAFDKLISGYRTFKASTYKQYYDAIQHVIRQGAKPTTLVISSCSLRIAPDTIMSVDPGALYIIRNIGGFVPPFVSEGANGTIAAIEYAVNVLQVENIIVMGHARCEGVNALIDPAHVITQSEGAIATWLSIMEPARNAVLEQLPDKSIEEQERACEQEAVLLSLKHLLGYPCVQARIQHGDIDIYGWHFNIETGILMAFNPETGFFDPIE